MAAGARDISAERRAGGANTLSAAIRLDARRLHARREALAAKSSGDAGGDPQALRHAGALLAENISVQAGSLEKTVIDSADAVNGADAVLLA